MSVDLTLASQVLCGDALAVLSTLPDGCVQTCVTSPPYFNLRDYSMAGQIGMESTPEEYIARLVAVFREVKRVLRDDGTCFINLGDSYCSAPAGNAPGQFSSSTLTNPARQDLLHHGKHSYAGGTVGRPKGAGNGIKPKDLLGIPWSVAFALRADGWYLRSDIIWAKTAVMPESVTDRPTKSHEYVFLLTKSARYFYDAEAIREEAARLPGSGQDGDSRVEYDGKRNGDAGAGQRAFSSIAGDARRNKRSVWTIGPEPFAGAHFAVMPTKLVEPCVRAGTSQRGCCPACFAPWERITERVGQSASVAGPKTQARRDQGLGTAFSGYADGSTCPNIVTVGWEPTCECGREPMPCLVLDPFTGSGTVGVVAAREGCRFIGSELNPEYVALANARIKAESSQPRLPFAPVGVEQTPAPLLPFGA